MAFRPPNRLEDTFRRSIQRVLLQYLKLPANATVEQILDKIDTLSRNEPLLARIGKVLAGQMVSQVNRSNMQGWREAAMESSRGRQIYEALRQEILYTPIGEQVRELVAQNAELISSIPSKVRESVNLEIAGLQREGLRPEAIARFLMQRVPQLTRSRAALIARTETGKAAEALTRARSEELGIPGYLWQTAEDQRVRRSHRIMDDVIVFWNDPPAPERLVGLESEGNYHAGGIYNCRCTAIPILRPEALKWPHRCYANGRIRSITLKQYREIAGMRVAA